MFQIIDEMSELIYVVDLENYHLLYMNKAGRDSFGVSDVKGHLCYKLVHGKDSPCEFCPNALLTEDAFYTWEHSNRKLDRHFLLKDRIIDWNGKKVKIEVAFDMTQKEAQQAALRNELEMENLITACAKKLIEADKEGNVLKDVLRMTGSYLHAENAVLFQEKKGNFEKTCEWSPEPGAAPKLPMKPDPTLLSCFRDGKAAILQKLEDIRLQFPEEYRQSAAEQIRSIAIVPLLWDDKCIGCLRLFNFPLPVSSGTNVLLTSIGFFLSSALYRQWSIRQLEKFGYFDTLTMLMNRNAYVRDLEKSFPFPVGVIYIDVNGIKEKNDLFGHQHGDSILVDTAKTIRRCCPGKRNYRVGGDEFVTICENISQEEFQHITDTLEQAFASKNNYTVALGSCWNKDPVDMQELLYRADERMYLDKQLHYRNNDRADRYRFTLDDVYSMIQPGRLQKLLQDDRFFIRYRPRFSMADQKADGIEAVVYYRGEEGKLILPDQFLPVLEEVRIIRTLDFYVLEEVCRQIHEWKGKADILLPVSIKISKSTLGMEGFIELLDSLLDKYSVPASLLEIETEIKDTKEQDTLLNTIETLKARGAVIIIDNFGIRNVNLNLFVSLDFDMLKLDKRMLLHLADNGKCRKTITALVDFCRKMDITVIADGIQSSGQYQILRATGCAKGLGDYFASPLPGDELEQIYFR